MSILNKYCKPLFYALLWIVLFFVLQFVGAFITVVVEFIKNPILLEVYQNTGVINDSIFTNMLFVTEIVSLIGVGIAFILVYKKRCKEIFKPIKFIQLIGVLCLSVIVCLGLTILLSLLPTTVTQTANESAALALGGGFLTNLIVAGLLAPLVEELTFRGGVIYNLEKINIHFAIIFSSLTFGLVHGNLVQGLYTFILGVILGYINKHFKSLIPSIIMHIVFNSSSVLLVALL